MQTITTIGLDIAKSVFQFTGLMLAEQASDRIWLVTLMDNDLGYFDDETCRLEPLANPFGPKVLSMSPERNVTHLSGTDQHHMAPGIWLPELDSNQRPFD